MGIPTVSSGAVGRELERASPCSIPCLDVEEELGRKCGVTVALVWASTVTGDWAVIMIGLQLLVGDRVPVW